MFCRKCGNNIPDDSMFCPKCGTKVTEESESKNVCETQEDTPQQTEESTKVEDKVTITSLIPKLEEMNNATEICDFLCTYNLPEKNKKTLQEFKEQELKFGNRKNQVLYTIKHWSNLDEIIEKIDLNTVIVETETSKQESEEKKENSYAPSKYKSAYSNNTPSHEISNETLSPEEEKSKNLKIGICFIIILIIIGVVISNNIKSSSASKAAEAQVKSWVYNYTGEIPKLTSEVIYHSNNHYIVVVKYKTKIDEMDLKGSYAIYTTGEYVLQYTNERDYDYDYNSHLEELKTVFKIVE